MHFKIPVRLWVALVPVRPVRAGCLISGMAVYPSAAIISPVMDEGSSDSSQELGDGARGNSCGYFAQHTLPRFNRSLFGRIVSSVSGTIGYLHLANSDEHPDPCVFANVFNDRRAPLICPVPLALICVPSSRGSEMWGRIPCCRQGNKSGNSITSVDRPHQ